MADGHKRQREWISQQLLPEGQNHYALFLLFFVTSWKTRFNVMITNKVNGCFTRIKDTLMLIW